MTSVSFAKLMRVTTLNFRSFMHFLTGVCAIVGGIFTGKAYQPLISSISFYCSYSSLFTFVRFPIFSCWAHRFHDLPFFSSAAEENRLGKSHLTHSGPITLRDTTWISRDDCDYGHLTGL